MNNLSKAQISAIHKTQAVLTALVTGKKPFYNLALYLKWGLVEWKGKDIVVTQKGKDILSVTV